MARLTRSADYSRVQTNGRRLRGANLMLLVAQGAAGETRVGLAVSRKVGGAVQRNRVKRWLREAIRSVPPPLGGPWDLVLIPYSEARDAGYDALRAQVGDLFARVRSVSSGGGEPNRRSPRPSGPVRR